MENKEDNNRPEATEAGATTATTQMPYNVDYCPRKKYKLGPSNSSKTVLSLLNSVNILHATVNAKLGFKNTILNTLRLKVD